MILPRHFCKEWPLYNASENSPNPLTIPVHQSWGPKGALDWVSTQARAREAVAGK